MIIISGATGLLGRAIYDHFQESGVAVIGTGLNRAQPPKLRLDLTDTAALTEFIKKHKPSTFIHCAAERRPDVSEKDPQGTLNLNVNVCKALGDLSKQYGFYLIYISTDYVFDGTSPPYSIDSTPNPLNFYGKSKLGGEEAIKKSGCNYAILRVPILYGKCENWESAVNCLLDVVKDQKPIDVDDFQSRFPTNVSDIARVLYDIVGNYFIYPNVPLEYSD